MIQIRPEDIENLKERHIEFVAGEDDVGDGSFRRERWVLEEDGNGFQFIRAKDSQSYKNRGFNRKNKTEVMRYFFQILTDSNAILFRFQSQEEMEQWLNRPY